MLKQSNVNYYVAISAQNKSTKCYCAFHSNLTKETYMFYRKLNLFRLLKKIRLVDFFRFLKTIKLVIIIERFIKFLIDET